MLDFQQILADYYPDFVRRRKRTARIIGKFLGFLFFQSRFEQFEREYPNLTGFDFVDAVLRFFDFIYDCEN